VSQLVEVSASNGLGYVRLTRSEKRNAINHALVDQLESGVQTLHDSDTRVAVLAADPPVFCAGADVNEALGSPALPATERLMAILLTSRLLWIACVEGPALGAGVAIAAACPVVLSTDNASFSLPELEIGLFPAGVMAYLEPIIGTRSALTLGLTGKMLSPVEASQLGLVTEVVPAASIDERVTWWHRHLTSHPTIVEAARDSWQATFTQQHISTRKQKLDSLLGTWHADA
jgi:enoyl-CoA hydratase/carnithine racemase